MAYGGGGGGCGCHRTEAALRAVSDDVRPIDDDGHLDVAAADEEDDVDDGDVNDGWDGRDDEANHFHPVLGRLLLPQLLRPPPPLLLTVSLS